MIDPQTLLNWPFEPIEHRFGARDTALYALGIGLGSDPMDPSQLRFVTHESPALQAFPTMAVILARPASFSADPASGIDHRMVVHGEQGLELLRPLPASGTVTGRSQITQLVDKGPGRGAVIYVQTTLENPQGDIIARLWSATFARADGGFGGNPAAPRIPHPIPHPIPDRAPDAIVDLPTFPNAALLYRLNGDLNPLHSDPETARAAGFPRPILHGLCTYGLAARAILGQFCDHDPARLKRFDLRFSAPVFPGETIAVHMWRNGPEIAFQAHIRDRQAKVIDNGLALIA